MIKHFSFSSQKDSPKLETSKSDDSEKRASSQDLASQAGVSGQTFIELLTQSVRKDLSLNQNNSNYEGDDESVETLSQISVTSGDNKSLSPTSSTISDDSELKANQTTAIEDKWREGIGTQTENKRKHRKRGYFRVRAWCKKVLIHYHRSYTMPGEQVEGPGHLRHSP